MEQLTIFNVADAFLKISRQTPKKLQKLCYYAYAWYYAAFHEKLFLEKFQAWVHGPANYDLYKKYESYGWNEIPQKADAVISPDLIGYTEWIWECYGHLDGNQLEMLTHQEPPWKIARGNLEPWENCEEIIKDEEIARFFGPKYAELQSQS